jgi:quinol monooxygenase YgiN
MSEQKVIVAGWYTVDPKRRDEVVENIKDLVLRARSAPGCLVFWLSGAPDTGANIYSDLSVYKFHL